MRCSITSTSGFRASIVARADAVFGAPTRPVVWITWRCRFDSSTTSSSTSPSVPIPAAARYSAAGEPRPAGADQQHLRVQQLELALDADLGEQGVARVAHPLLPGQALGRDDREAGLLPGLDPAGHRGDVLVSELALERVRRAGGAIAGRAVEQHALRAIGRQISSIRSRHLRGRDESGARRGGTRPTRAGSRVSIRTTSPRAISSRASSGSISSTRCLTSSSGSVVAISVILPNLDWVSRLYKV